MAEKSTTAKNNELSAKAINRLVYESGFFCHDCGEKTPIFPTYWCDGETLDTFFCEYGINFNKRKCYEFRCPACASKDSSELFYCDKHRQH